VAGWGGVDPSMPASKHTQVHADGWLAGTSLPYRRCSVPKPMPNEPSSQGATQRVPGAFCGLSLSFAHHGYQRLPSLFISPAFHPINPSQRLHNRGAVHASGIIPVPWIIAQLCSILASASSMHHEAGHDLFRVQMLAFLLFETSHAMSSSSCTASSHDRVASSGVGS